VVVGLLGDSKTSHSPYSAALVIEDPLDLPKLAYGAGTPSGGARCDSTLGVPAAPVDVRAVADLTPAARAAAPRSQGRATILA
jgi:hypothetical protein